MLLLKHVRDWSYETLTREVRANLVYREFTRVGGEKVPDDRTSFIVQAASGTKALS
jgi:IS5 family transposase